MRRFAKSVRGLGITRSRALRFAARWLREAGVAPRPILERVPPYDTHGRYDAGSRSGRYRDRNPARTARELALLARVWPGRHGDVVVDVPCGAGRLGPFVRARGAAWLPGDRSVAMLHEARDANGATAPICCDVGRLPFGDRGVDGVVVFRLLHHLDEAAARRAVTEATRVADRFVVVSFFHPCSFHNLKRTAKRLLLGTARTRYSLRRSALRAWFRDRGFAPRGFVAESPYRRDLWIGAFERVSDPCP